MGRRRRRTSEAEDMIEIFSQLPWWVCFLLAVISYVVLNHYATGMGEPIDTTGVKGGIIGEFVVRQMWHTLAFFGQILVPALLGIAGLASGIRKIKINRRNAAKG